MKRIWNIIRAKIHIILPLITAVCLLGFIGSLLIPDTVLDTYIVNMQEEEDDTEEILLLSGDAHVNYEMDTEGKAMRGIQIGINKLGKQISGIFCYDVYVKTASDERELVSSNQYEIALGDDLQYVYLPYATYENCVGELFIDFYMQNAVSEEAAPAIMANHKEVKKTVTTYDGVEGISLKGNYIYTHNTYPFLYDFRVMTFIMLAATMTIAFPKRKQRKVDENHAH